MRTRTSPHSWLSIATTTLRAVVVDGAVLVLAAALAAVGLLGLERAGVVDSGVAVVVTAIALISAAGVVLGFAAHVAGHADAVRLSAVLMVAGAVVMPLLGVQEASPTTARELRLGLLIGAVVLAALLVRGCLHGRGAARAWPSAAVAMVVVLGTVGAGVLRPSLVPSSAVLDGLAPAALAVFAAACGLLTVHGVRLGDSTLRRCGGALLVFSGVIGARAAGVLEPRAGAVLGLAAVGLLTSACLHFTAQVIRRAREAHEVMESELHDAQVKAVATADREHEMRNVVLGLTVAFDVLDDSVVVGVSERASLASGTRSELQRLQLMLADTPAPLGAAPTRVGPLLADLAAMHRCGGLRLAVQVEPELRTDLPGAVLAQVVTNLLVNCSRHAPGASVELSAWRWGSEVVIEVTDDGPGLPPGDSTAVLQRGARGLASGGSGLGLTITASLLATHAGSLSMVPTRTGCTARVVVPAARWMPAQPAHPAMSIQPPRRHEAVA